MQSISLKIDVSKISKPDLYQGKKGVYLDALLFENREGKSDYGDDGFIVQGISKDKRDAGERGPIVGNWRYMSGGKHDTNIKSDEDGPLPF